jgi:hypothetical protein
VTSCEYPAPVSVPVLIDIFMKQKNLFQYRKTVFNIANMKNNLKKAYEFCLSLPVLKYPTKNKNPESPGLHWRPIPRAVFDE